MTEYEKQIFIPIELKNRELLSQLLLTHELIKNGYTIYLGSHAAIFKALKVKKGKSGIYIDKSTQILARTKFISAKVNHMFILDQELSPSIEKIDSTLVESRIDSGTKKYISGYFVVGKKFKDAAIKAGIKSNKVFITGWPRFDLQVFYLEKIYGDKIKKIKDKYGKFNLFVSDFTFIQPKEKFSQYQSKVLLGGLEANKWNDIYNDFMKTKSVIKNLDSSKLVNKLIIRPHITESNKIWKNSLEKNNTIMVIKSGDIVPWLAAAEIIIHRGSTAAIQAYLMNKEVFFLKDSALSHNRKFVSIISTSISHEQFINQEFKSRIKKNDKELINLFNNLIALDDIPSSKKISDIIQKYKVDLSLTINKSIVFSSYFSFNSIKRFFGLLKDEILFMLKKSRVYPQSTNLGWGIKKNEIRNFFNLLEDKKNNKVNVDKIGVNLFKICITK